MSTFVTVGNATQPFERLLRAVEAVTPHLPRPIVVQGGVGSAFHPAWEMHEFLPMEIFERLVAASSVLITHAGAGSVIHAIRAGKRPIVMPRRALLGEHVDGHQLEFAEALGAAGKVVVVEDAESLRKAVTEASPQGQRTDKQPELVAHVAALLRECAAQR